MQWFKAAKRKVTGWFDGGVEDDDDYGQNVYGGYDDDFDDEPVEELELPRSQKDGKDRKGNVIDFNASRESTDVTTVVIVRPKEMQDATRICDYLREGKICIVNMQDAEHALSQRIADYLGGVSYTLNGNIERVDSYIFAMTPESTKITEDLIAGFDGGGAGMFKSFRKME